VCGSDAARSTHDSRRLVVSTQAQPKALRPPSDAQRKTQARLLMPRPCPRPPASPTLQELRNARTGLQRAALIRGLRRRQRGCVLQAIRVPQAIRVLPQRWHV
jgi:hypothetical protein